jgi:hypothetical protein
MPDLPADAPAASASPSPELDRTAQTAAFMDALLGYAPDDHHALLWTLQDKRSSWVALDKGSEPVALRARELADEGKDVYVAVALAGAAVPRTYDSRIKSANAAGIFGLWADLDIADPDVHKKWNLPPTVDAAMELLTACGREPSLVVHSGHGLQAWWLFHEFWAFDSDEDRLAAAGLAQRWNATLQSHAAERSWVVDSTFDLARVMRVPGTLNRKGTPVMPVRLLQHDGPRWNPSDIEERCRDESMLNVRGLSSAKTYTSDLTELSEATKIDHERFQALLDNDEKFAPTWDKKRKDLSDQSPSTYDLALATAAARAQWPDEEIGALIRDFRRRHKLDVEKARRVDYIRRTIEKARTAVARDVSAELMDDVAEELSEAIAADDPERERDARRATLDVLGTRLSLELVHLIKYESEPPAYALQTPVKLVPLGDVDGLLQWHKFKKAIAEGLDEIVDRFATRDWDDITRLMMKALTKQDVGAEATDRGEIAAWLSAYLAARPAVDSLQEAATSEYPYVAQDGRVVLFGPAFRRWLYLTYQERITNKELGRRLRAFGCEPDKVNVEDADGKRTSRGIWRLPTGVGT